MADNVALTPGAGATFRTDDVGGVHYPVTKLDAGGDGVSVPVSASNPLPVADLGRVVTFQGSAQTFRTPGRAGTTGQKILTLHNATGSTTIARVSKVTVDLNMTVVKAVTVIPPIVRLWKFTALPTNGTALTKVSRDSRLTSNASVTVFGDASADGTNSTTALTVTLPAGQIITQEFAPRLITAAGYEIADRLEFLVGGDDVVLGALEGVCVFLDYTLATANPTTDMWVAGVHWTEAAA